jgi:hypothetical protein
MKSIERAITVLMSLLLVASVAAGQSRRQKPIPNSGALNSEELRKLAEDASKARANLIATTRKYRESLEAVLDLQRHDEETARALFDKRKILLEQGIISRRELDESELVLAEWERRVTDTTEKIEQADQLVTEVAAAEESSKLKTVPSGSFHSGVTLIRYSGTSNWQLTDQPRINAFFLERFGRALPISAFGQTEVHERLGFDHRGAMDVAIHPDTSEGQTLMAYLRSQGIPFIAFRAAVAGSATGAHIHIGPPSHRTSQ